MMEKLLFILLVFVYASSGALTITPITSTISNGTVYTCEKHVYSWDVGSSTDAVKVTMQRHPDGDTSDATLIVTDGVPTEEHIDQMINDESCALYSSATTGSSTSISWECPRETDVLYIIVQHSDGNSFSYNLTVESEAVPASVVVVPAVADENAPANAEGTIFRDVGNPVPTIFARDLYVMEIVLPTLVPGSRIGINVEEGGDFNSTYDPSYSAQLRLSYNKGASFSGCSYTFEGELANFDGDTVQHNTGGFASRTRYLSHCLANQGGSIFFTFHFNNDYGRYRLKWWVEEPVIIPINIGDEIQYALEKFDDRVYFSFSRTAGADNELVGVIDNVLHGEVALSLHPANIAWSDCYNTPYECTASTGCAVHAYLCDSNPDSLEENWFLGVRSIKHDDVIPTTFSLSLFNRDDNPTVNEVAVGVDYQSGINFAKQGSYSHFRVDPSHYLGNNTAGTNIDWVEMHVYFDMNKRLGWDRMEGKLFAHSSIAGSKDHCLDFTKMCDFTYSEETSYTCHMQFDPCELEEKYPNGIYFSIYAVDLHEFLYYQEDVRFTLRLDTWNPTQHAYHFMSLPGLKESEAYRGQWKVFKIDHESEWDELRFDLTNWRTFHQHDDSDIYYDQCKAAMQGGVANCIAEDCTVCGDSCVPQCSCSGESYVLNDNCVVKRDVEGDVPPEFRVYVFKSDTPRLGATCDCWSYYDEDVSIPSTKLLGYKDVQYSGIIEAGRCMAKGDVYVAVGPSPSYNHGSGEIVSQLTKFTLASGVVPPNTQRFNAQMLKPDEVYRIKDNMNGRYNLEVDNEYSDFYHVVELDFERMDLLDKVIDVRFNTQRGGRDRNDLQVLLVAVDKDEMYPHDDMMCLMESNWKASLSCIPGASRRPDSYIEGPLPTEDRDECSFVVEGGCGGVRRRNVHIREDEEEVSGGVEHFFSSNTDASRLFVFIKIESDSEPLIGDLTYSISRYSPIHLSNLQGDIAWERQTAPDGRVYFYNPQTGETSWDIEDLVVMNNEGKMVSGQVRYDRHVDFQFKVLKEDVGSNSLVFNFYLDGEDDSEEYNIEGLNDDYDPNVRSENQVLLHVPYVYMNTPGHGMYGPPGSPYGCRCAEKSFLGTSKFSWTIIVDACDLEEGTYSFSFFANGVRRLSVDALRFTAKASLKPAISPIHRLMYNHPIDITVFEKEWVRHEIALPDKFFSLLDTDVERYVRIVAEIPERFAGSNYRLIVSPSPNPCMCDVYYVDSCYTSSAEKCEVEFSPQTLARAVIEHEFGEFPEHNRWNLLTGDERDALMSHKKLYIYMSAEDVEEEPLGLPVSLFAVKENPHETTLLTVNEECEDDDTIDWYHYRLNGTALDFELGPPHVQYFRLNKTALTTGLEYMRVRFANVTEGSLSYSFGSFLPNVDAGSWSTCDSEVCEDTFCNADYIAVYGNPDTTANEVEYSIAVCLEENHVELKSGETFWEERLRRNTRKRYVYDFSEVNANETVAVGFWLTMLDTSLPNGGGSQTASWDVTQSGECSDCDSNFSDNENSCSGNFGSNDEQVPDCFFLIPVCALNSDWNKDKWVITVTARGSDVQYNVYAKAFVLPEITVQEVGNDEWTTAFIDPFSFYVLSFTPSPDVTYSDGFYPFSVNMWHNDGQEDLVDVWNVKNNPLASPRFCDSAPYHLPGSYISDYQDLTKMYPQNEIDLYYVSNKDNCEADPTETFYYIMYNHAMVTAFVNIEANYTYAHAKMVESQQVDIANTPYFDTFVTQPLPQDWPSYEEPEFTNVRLELANPLYHLRSQFASSIYTEVNMDGSAYRGVRWNHPYHHDIFDLDAEEQMYCAFENYDMNGDNFLANTYSGFNLRRRQEVVCPGSYDGQGDLYIGFDNEANLDPINTNVSITFIPPVDLPVETPTVLNVPAGQSLYVYYDFPLLNWAHSRSLRIDIDVLSGVTNTPVRFYYEHDNYNYDSQQDYTPVTLLGNDENNCFRNNDMDGDYDPITLSNYTINFGNLNSFIDRFPVTQERVRGYFTFYNPDDEGVDASLLVHVYMEDQNIDLVEPVDLLTTASSQTFTNYDSVVNGETVVFRIPTPTAADWLENMYLHVYTPFNADDSVQPFRVVPFTTFRTRYEEDIGFDSMSNNLDSLSSVVVGAPFVNPDSYVDVVTDHFGQNFTITFEWKSTPTLKVGLSEEITTSPIEFATGDIAIFQLDLEKAEGFNFGVAAEQYARYSLYSWACDVVYYVVSVKYPIIGYEQNDRASHLVAAGELDGTDSVNQDYEYSHPSLFGSYLEDHDVESSNVFITFLTPNGIVTSGGADVVDRVGVKFHLDNNYAEITDPLEWRAVGSGECASADVRPYLSEDGGDSFFNVCSPPTSSTMGSCCPSVSDDVFRNADYFYHWEAPHGNDNLGVVTFTFSASAELRDLLDRNDLTEDFTSIVMYSRDEMDFDSVLPESNYDRSCNLNNTNGVCRFTIDFMDMEESSDRSYHYNTFIYIKWSDYVADWHNIDRASGGPGLPMGTSAGSLCVHFHPATYLDINPSVEPQYIIFNQDNEYTASTFYRVNHPANYMDIPNYSPRVRIIKSEYDESEFYWSHHRDSYDEFIQSFDFWESCWNSASRYPNATSCALASSFDECDTDFASAGNMEICGDDEHYYSYINGRSFFRLVGDQAVGFFEISFYLPEAQPITGDCMHLPATHPNEYNLGHHDFYVVQNAPAGSFVRVMVKINDISDDGVELLLGYGHYPLDHSESVDESDNYYCNIHEELYCEANGETKYCHLDVPHVPMGNSSWYAAVRSAVDNSESMIQYVITEEVISPEIVTLEDGVWVDIGYEDYDENLDCPIEQPSEDTKDKDGFYRYTARGDGDYIILQLRGLYGVAVITYGGITTYDAYDYSEIIMTRSCYSESMCIIEITCDNYKAGDYYIHYLNHDLIDNTDPPSIRVIESSPVVTDVPFGVPFRVQYQPTATWDVTDRRTYRVTVESETVDMADWRKDVIFDVYGSMSYNFYFEVNRAVYGNCVNVYEEDEDFLRTDVATVSACNLHRTNPNIFYITIDDEYFHNMNSFGPSTAAMGFYIFARYSDKLSSRDTDYYSPMILHTTPLTSNVPVTVPLSEIYNGNTWSMSFSGGLGDYEVAYLHIVDTNQDYTWEAPTLHLPRASGTLDTSDPTYPECFKRREMNDLDENSCRVDHPHYRNRRMHNRDPRYTFFVDSAAHCGGGLYDTVQFFMRPRSIHISPDVMHGEYVPLVFTPIIERRSYELLTNQWAAGSHNRSDHMELSFYRAEISDSTSHIIEFRHTWGLTFSVFVISDDPYTNYGGEEDSEMSFVCGGGSTCRWELPKRTTQLGSTNRGIDDQLFPTSSTTWRIIVQATRSAWEIRTISEEADICSPIDSSVAPFCAAGNFTAGSLWGVNSDNVMRKDKYAMNNYMSLKHNWACGSDAPYPGATMDCDCAVLPPMCLMALKKYACQSTFHECVTDDTVGGIWSAHTVPHSVCLEVEQYCSNAVVESWEDINEEYSCDRTHYYDYPIWTTPYGPDSDVPETIRAVPGSRSDAGWIIAIIFGVIAFMMLVGAAIYGKFDRDS